MEEQLDNPVFFALQSKDARLGGGTEQVKFFDEEVSPFAGFPEGHENGFAQLYDLLPPGRRILYATRKQVTEPAGWKLQVAVQGLQFVFTGESIASHYSLPLILLEQKHADEMIALARLTKPGPFSKRTIEFGHYYGIFNDGKLVAMTGQRLHTANYTEVSAVCTHPDHSGKGYAAALVQRQLEIICQSGEIPFLHVRADNERAIALYERLGFSQNGAMNFYFFKKQ